MDAIGDCRTAPWRMGSQHEHALGSSQIMERRLVVGVLLDWRERAGRRDMPSWHEVAASILLDTRFHCTVIELDCNGKHRLRRVGTALLPAPSETPLKWLEAVPPGSLLAHAARVADVLTEWAVPVLRGGSFKAADAYCLHRGVVLPLGERGIVTHIVAAASASHVEVVPDLDRGAEASSI
jgi:hypothetical protein